jgi:type IV pilus assembly protein PilW
MNYYDRNNERGFTLVELLIAMTIGLIIMTALSSTFLMQRKIYDVQEQVAEMVQTARAAMDMMTREIRMAGYNPTGAGFDGITYDAHQLQIQANIDDDENIINADGSYDENENITYTYYDENSAYPYQIKRKTDNGNFVSFAENIEEFTFVYLKADGVTEVTTSAENDDIRQIKITITARTARPDRDYTHPTYGDHYRRYTLTSVITPRNLDL